MRRIAPVLILTACPEPLVEEDPVPLSDRVDADRMVAHLTALEAIGDAQGGNRQYLSGGYADSVDYVVAALEEAGYTVTLDPFEMPRFIVAEASLTRGEDGFEFGVFEHSGSGDVTAEVVPVDLLLPAGAANDSDSGCESRDFDGFPAGAIALLQRGECAFVEKVANAEDAGAAAVLMFNEGQPERSDVFFGALDPDAPASIPVLALSYADGVALSLGGTAHVVVQASVELQTDTNILAETPGGDPSRVVMVGAHLDSVAAGPGVNDNGSGTALVLEMALQMAAAGTEPRNKVRFAWWGAEEQGLIGSSYYFYDDNGDPDDAVLSTLDAYLNFDMVASGNGVRFVYDGDGSDELDEYATPGSAEIESIFLDWYDAKGLDTEPEGLLLPTDSYWTVALGVPTGGLFSGAFDVKTTGEATRYGGEVGVEHDACYHQACDRVDHLNVALYQDLGEAAAHALETLADREAPLPTSTTRAARALDRRPRGCHDAGWVYTR
jgi:Zn-dependent M28 family amino/carboxypeptidase